MRKENEKYFIITESPIIIEKLLEKNGFRIKKSECQVNKYIDHSFLNLLENNLYYRFRYCTSIAEGEFLHGEISFSKREVTDKNIEIRKQFNKIFENKEDLDIRFIYYKELGWRNTLTLHKFREVFSQSNRSEFENEIHIELDTCIRIQDEDVFFCDLEDTLQICMEGEVNDFDEKVKQIMKLLELKEEQVTKKGYLERFQEKRIKNLK